MPSDPGTILNSPREETQMQIPELTEACEIAFCTDRAGAAMAPSRQPRTVVPKCPNGLAMGPRILL